MSTKEISSKQLIKILTDHEVRKTEARVQVLGVFFKHEYALGHSDLEIILGDDFDRVTLYRTLNTLEQAGVLHLVPSEGENKYGLCRTACSHDAHNDNHIHFNCVKCKQTYCLDHLIVDNTIHAGEYEIHTYNIAAKGICKNCKN
jgi:Fur family ferric uptake transcriptional regulator